MTFYNIQKKENKNYIGDIPPLIKWGMFCYKGFFINTYHTPDEDGFDRYVDKDQLIYLRKSLAMNQKQFSKFLNIGLRSLQKIESGNSIGLHIIHKMQNVLGETKYTWT